MSFCRGQRCAFTLIEMIVAVVILGVMAGAAAWSFRSSLRSAGAREVVEQIRFLDSAARQRAGRFGQRVEIIFDVSESSLARREGGRRNEESYRSALPRGWRIEQVNVAGRSTFDGEAVVACSALGQSQSYAVHLVGPEVEQWILFAGMSGQMVVLPGKDEATVLDILAPSRRNAD